MSQALFMWKTPFQRMFGLVITFVCIFALNLASYNRFVISKSGGSFYGLVRAESFQIKFFFLIFLENNGN